MILDRPCREERNIVVRQCTHQIKYQKCKLPRRCFLSSKWLFMKDSVRVTRVWTSTLALNPTGDPPQFTQHFWVDSKEYLLLTLGTK